METAPLDKSHIEAVARIQVRAMVASPFYDEATDEQVVYKRIYPRVAGYFAGTYHPGHALPERAGFVAIADGAIRGFIAGHKTTRMGCTGELQWMFVGPDWQRKGIGSMLLLPLAEWFSAGSSSKVIVDASPENPSRPFYLKHGASAFDEYWLFWPDIGILL